MCVSSWLAVLVFVGKQNGIVPGPQAVPCSYQAYQPKPKGRYDLPGRDLRTVDRRIVWLKIICHALPCDQLHKYKSTYYYYYYYTVDVGVREDMLAMPWALALSLRGLVNLVWHRGTPGS